MSEPKVFVPKSSAKSRTFPDGGEQLKLSFHAETLAAFIKQNTNKRGYINFNVSKRREVGQFGDTHSIVLDTWEPDPSKKRQAPAEAERSSAAGEAPKAEAEEQEVPF